MASMKLQREKIPFTLIANEVLKDAKLSLKAKGLYAYLFSKPDDWDFSSTRMATEMMEGRKTIMTTLRELEEKGYLDRIRLGNGKMEYTLRYSEKSLSPKKELGVEDPKSPLGTGAFGHGGEREPISNTESTTKTEEKVINTAQAQKF